MNNSELWEKNLHEIAQMRLGLGELKLGQLEVLRVLFRRESVVGIFPTGYGKSLCFQMPALAWGWRSVIVSPLLALMADQKRKMQAMGIRVLDFHSQVNRRTKRKNYRDLWSGCWDVVLLSPERLSRWEKRGIWSELSPRVNLLILDEAHCFHDWCEFRPAYKELDTLISRQGNLCPVLALSATLETSALEKLEKRWELCFYRASEQLGRDNIYLDVLPLETRAERFLVLLSYLRGLQSPRACVIYCGTRRSANMLAGFLDAAGYNALSYHAGLPDPVKTTRLSNFLEGRVPILCATSAFGLGMDYPWVERVVHWGLPPDVESYWQEVGRAGRSGKPAFGLLIWNFSDLLFARGLLWKKKSADTGARIEKLQQCFSYLTTRLCRKQWIADYLGLKSSACGNCDNCLHLRNVPRRLPWDYLPGAYKNPWWIDEKCMKFFPAEFFREDFHSCGAVRLCQEDSKKQDAKEN